MSADRPATPEIEIEIEITPEMIEAGVEAFADHRSDYATPRECVEAVYLAMRLIQSSPCGEGCASVPSTA